MPRSRFAKPLSGKKFPPVLNEPIERPIRGLALLQLNGAKFNSEAAKLAMRQYELEQIHERVEALYNHYFPRGEKQKTGIFLGDGWQPRTSFHELQKEELVALIDRLGADFLKGFQTKSRDTKLTVGAKKIIDKPEKWQPLFEAVDSRLTAGHTLSRACQLVAKDKNGPFQGTTAKAIQERYKRVLSAFAANEPTEMWKRAASAVTKTA